MHLLYPSNPLRTREPDDQFTDEVEAVCAVGLMFRASRLKIFKAESFVLLCPASVGGRQSEASCQ